MPASAAPRQLSPPVFWLAFVATLWLAHALAFFAHEYAHAWAAYFLHVKANPFQLAWARPSAVVWLFQLGISQGVEEAPLFAAGQGWKAAAISAAGMLVGNALVSWSAARLLARWAGARPVAGLLAYWLTVASLGNLLDYVPIRTWVPPGDLTQDMWAVEQGLRLPPWGLLAVLGPLVVVYGYFFFARIQPRTLPLLFPRARWQRAATAAGGALFLFGFYGAAGWSGSGEVAHALTVASVCVLAPAAACAGVVEALRGEGCPP
jgi:hypothetical protein